MSGLNPETVAEWIRLWSFYDLDPECTKIALQSAGEQIIADLAIFMQESPDDVKAALTSALFELI